MTVGVVLGITPVGAVLVPGRFSQIQFQAKKACLEERQFHDKLRAPETLAVHEELPAPMGNFCCDGLWFVRAVPRTTLARPAKTRGPLGDVAKGGRKQKVRPLCFAGQLWLACFKQLLEQVLFVQGVGQTHRRNAMLRLHRAPEIAMLGTNRGQPFSVPLHQAMARAPSR